MHMPSTDTQFKKGHPGRPKGTRNKITKAFLKALAADFKEHGKSVIERVRKESPEVYIRLAAQLVPKDIDVRHSGDVTVQVVNYSEADEYQPVNVTQRKEEKLNGDTAARKQTSFV